MNQKDRIAMLEQWNRESKILGQFCANDLPGDPEADSFREYDRKDPRGNGPRNYVPPGQQ